MVVNRHCPFCGNHNTYYKGIDTFYCKDCHREFSWTTPEETKKEKP